MADEVAARAGQVASHIGKAALTLASLALQQDFSHVIDARAALAAAGTVDETLASAFSADPSLAQRHRDVAEQVAAANAYSRGTLSSILRMMANDWIASRIDELDRIVPGVKQRQLLSAQMKAQAAEIDKILDHPLALFNGVTNNIDAAALDKIEKDIQQAAKNEPRRIALEDQLIHEMDRALPGFLAWFNLEASRCSPGAE